MIRAALVCWLVAHAAVAWAAEPACFPERTVLQTTALVDAAGRPIGTIRGGRQVRVLADSSGRMVRTQTSGTTCASAAPRRD